MIKKIGIENFRIFKDYTEFELASLTVLTGPNNSGKSSFIKLLNLLKYSYTGKRGIDQLNFDGGNHNLGSVDKVFHWDSDSEEIKIVFDIPLAHFIEKFKLELIYIKQHEIATLTSIRIYNENRVLLHYFYSADNFKSYQLDDEERHDAFYNIDLAYVNQALKEGTDVDSSKSLFFDYYLDGEVETDSQGKYFEIYEMFESSFSRYYYPFPSDDRDTEGNYFIDCLNYIPFEGYLKDLNDFINERTVLKGAAEDPYYLKEIVDLYSIGKSEIEIESFKQLLMTFYVDLSEDLSKIKIKLNNYEKLKQKFHNNIINGIRTIINDINKINFIAATRGSKKRILSNQSDNDIDAVAKEFYHITNDGKLNEDFLKDALKILGIKGELVVERSEGVISIVYVKQGDKKINLADFGFGYSQIIPILMQLAIIDANNS